MPPNPSQPSFFFRLPLLCPPVIGDFILQQTFHPALRHQSLSRIFFLSPHIVQVCFRICNIQFTFPQPFACILMHLFRIRKLLFPQCFRSLIVIFYSIQLVDLLFPPLGIVLCFLFNRFFPLFFLHIPYFSAQSESPCAYPRILFSSRCMPCRASPSNHHRILF